MGEKTLYSVFQRLAGPVLAGAGAVVVAVILFSPVAERGPAGWWMVKEALSFRRVLPLIGLGTALALLPRRTGLISFGAFFFGIVSGWYGIDALIAAVVQIPGGGHYHTLGSLVSPVAFLAAGVALASPARVRPYLAPLGAFATGASFVSFVRLTYPMFGDPGVVKAGIMFGLWIIVASALSIGAFRQPWFAIAGTIVGSWFIVIALLDGSAVLLKYRNNTELLNLTGPMNPYPGKLGVIEEDAYADLILADGNPLENIDLIADTGNNFVVVMKDGKIYKNTLK